MTPSVKNLLFIFLFSVLGIFGMCQFYYLLVPHNIAYKLKSENFRLSAFEQEKTKNSFNTVKVLKDLFPKKFESAKEEGLIVCDEKNQTNWVEWCRDLYSYSFSDTQRYEIAKNWCAYKPAN